MHTKRIYLIVLTLLILIYKRGYCLDKHECLTWEINSNLLTLICRLKHFSEPVILIDNHEHEYIGCFFNEAINACHSRPKRHNITVDNSTNTVILTIEDVHKKNVNGKWKCKQGKNIFETEVSISKGIISATNLHISGVLQNTGTDSQVVKLTCYSCREPRKSNIEFSINGSSIDSIAYNKNTGHCTHKDGFCKPQDCFCDPSGNEFTRLFYVTNANVIYFSCYTSFLDNDKKSIFSMNVTILFNEKAFHYIGSETKVLKPSSQNYEDDNRTKSASSSLNTTHIESSEMDSKRTEIPVILWIVVGVSIIIVLVPPVILIFLCVRNLIILTKGEMNEKTVDNMENDGKPSGKEAVTGISETNTEEIHVCAQTTYIENKSSDEIRKTTSDSSPLKEADEATTSEYSSYISYANVVQNDSDEQPEEVPGSKDISESIHQKDDMEFDLTEGETNEKTVDNIVRHGKPSHNETEPIISETNTQEIGDKTAYIAIKSSEKIKQTTKDDSVSFKLADEATTSECGSYISYAKVVQNNFDEQPEEVPGSKDIFESTHQKYDMEFDLAECETKTSGYGAKVVQNNIDEPEEIPGSEYVSESTLQKDVKELNTAEGIDEILKIMSNVCQQCVKTSDVPVCYWCLDCNKAVCECCKENHFQSHQFEKISSPLILMKIPNCCGNHHDKEFQCFCKDHYSLCCIDCLIQDHRGCLNIEYIVDAIKGFKSHIVFDKYKKFLKSISKSFGNLKNILETGKNDVQVRKYSHQSKKESKFHRFVKISEQESFKEKFLEKVKNDKNTCLLKLQKQISIVSKCETDIKTIETSFERIWEQLSEEKLFLMVHLSMKFLESTLKKAISDSESINLEFTSMRVGETNCEYEIFGTRQKVLPQNLLALLVKQELADYGTSLPQFY